MPLEIIPVISLFCGAGGMDLGFRQAGFQPLVAIDIDPTAVDSYNWNDQRGVARQADLSKLTNDEFLSIVRNCVGSEKPRGVIGGPPCQSFSKGNVHRKRIDNRRKLPFRYAEILHVLNREFTLDFFVFENVIGLTWDRHKRYFKKVITAFEEAGFVLHKGELDAAHFGVPQRRERLVVVGINKDTYPNLRFQFPIGTAGVPLTVRSAIEGLPQPVFYDRYLTREDIPFHHNHWTMRPRSAKFSSTSVENGRSFKKLRWDEPSWTVAYGHREIHVHPSGTRRVSILEAMLLQGFPRHYELRGNLSQQVTQVSDAVPPPLAFAVAQAIKETVYQRTQHLQQALLGWFQDNNRSFPWRCTDNPFKVLIAEKLLQQTAASDVVVNVYNELIAQFPDAASLAKADPAAIRTIIGRLGLAYRANELPRLGQAICDCHGGQVPSDLKALLELPGVGDYIARAVLAFAFGQDVPIVDTNVARWLYRLYGMPERLPSNPARHHTLMQMATALVPHGKAKAYNLALLDLCAAICTAREPDCCHCPIMSMCAYGQAAVTERVIGSSHAST